MCRTIRKQRVTFTLQEDVLLLRDVVANHRGNIGGVSKQQWAVIAQRMTTHGVVVTVNGLRRRVADMVKKHKLEESESGGGGATSGGRMRWGMAWPKSDDEVERDRLIGEYVKQLALAKQQQHSTQKPPKLQNQVPAIRSSAAVPVTTVPVPIAVDLTDPTGQSLTKLPKMPTKSRIKRKELPVVEPIANQDNDYGVFALDIDYDAGHSHRKFQGDDLETKSSERLDLKRRRLDMEERVQNRMLDIQGEQIALQREQLRLQAESMRVMAESTQAIARALHALSK